MFHVITGRRRFVSLLLSSSGIKTENLCRGFASKSSKRRNPRHKTWNAEGSKMMSKNVRNKWAQMKKQKGVGHNNKMSKKNNESIAAGLGFKDSNKKTTTLTKNSKTAVLTRKKRAPRPKSELRDTIKSLNDKQLEAIRYFAKLMFPMKNHYVEKRQKEMKAYARDIRACVLEVRTLSRKEAEALEDFVSPFRVRTEDLNDANFIELLQNRLKDRCREVDTFFKGVSERKDRISRMDRTARKRKMKSIMISRKGVTAKDLSSDLGVSLSKLIRKLDREGVRINRDSFLSCENAEIAVLAFDREPILSDVDRDEHLVTHRLGHEEQEEQEQRQPIIAVMGHVDHGKTTLLDTIRNQSGKTTSQEAGGITQSVRAFEAQFGDLRSTFIDTPGHAAFMAMRESGAAATDVVLLVVSAKDGVKDQTVETLRIATEHKLPIVLALNKIDLLDQYEREALRSQVESDLLTHGFASEGMGGEIQVVEISAKTAEGFEDLEEALSLQTEILELNTNLSAPGEALILESQIDPRIGTYSSALVRWGTMRVGDHVVCGKQSARVKQLFVLDEGEHPRSVHEAGAGQPVLFISFTHSPRTQQQQQQQHRYELLDSLNLFRQENECSQQHLRNMLKVLLRQE
jgi:small GTP-binding protein